MLIKIYDANPQANEIRKVVDALRKGEIIIFPTDSVYAFGCDIFNTNGVEYIAKLKNRELRRANLSFICDSISQISQFAVVEDITFKLIKKNLPGPFTFILEGNNKLPKLFKNKKTIGVRMPNNTIAMEIVHLLGNPLMVSSIFTDEKTTEYITNPELIEELYGKKVSIVIDGGMGGLEPSTVVDCTGNEPVIVRQGGGKLVLV